MNKAEQNNLIKKTILRTSMWFVGGVALIMFVISNVFPLAFAKLCLNFGLDNKAAYYYERNYKLNPDINSLYLTTDMYVFLDNSQKIIYYVPILQGKAQYKTLTENVDNLNSFGSENDRLTSKYVLALIDVNGVEAAKSFLRTILSKPGIEEYPPMQITSGIARILGLDTEVDEYESKL